MYSNVLNYDNIFSKMIQVDIGQILLRQENEKKRKEKHFTIYNNRRMLMDITHLSDTMLLIMENYHTILWS